MISILGDREAMATLGARIREARLQRNLPQAHVASIVGVSLPTYRKIEAGDGTMEFRHVVRTLAVLGYVDAVAALVPPLEAKATMQEILAANDRKRASPMRRPGPGR